MQYTIEHEVPGRMRIRLSGVVRNEDVDPLSRVLLDFPAILDVTVYPRIGSVALIYGSLDADAARACVLDFLSTLNTSHLDAVRSDYTFALATRTHGLALDLASLAGGFIARRLLLPAPLDMLFAIWQYRRFLLAAIQSLRQGKLGVPTLDAAAIAAAFAQGDAATASETMFLLDTGELMEDYTRARSENELIYSLLAVPDVAARIEHGQEVSVPATELGKGDLIVIRTGQPVPIDGTVTKGCAMVNQAALTGEPLPVERTTGDTVYAGTAVDEGEVFVRVLKATDKTRLRSIVSLVEHSGGHRSRSEERRERLADSIVPWNFLLAAVVAATTRSITKTAARLMDKRIKKHSKVFRRAAEHAGAVDADACVRSFEQHLANMFSSDLFREHDVYPTVDVEHVYAVIAMCLKLREHGLSDKEVRDAVNEGFAARRRFFDALIRAIDRLPFAWAIVRRWNVSDHAKRVADGSIDYDRFEASAHTIEYEISGCRYVDMFEAWGARSLCKIFCETDTRSYAGLTRHVRFVRHSDLSDGPSCHDELFDAKRG